MYKELASQAKMYKELFPQAYIYKEFVPLDLMYKCFQSKPNVGSIYQQRLDNTRTMLIGGFDPVFADQGGEQNEKTWIFNTTHWKSTAPSLVARDRPACCIVNMPDGKV